MPVSISEHIVSIDCSVEENFAAATTCGMERGFFSQKGSRVGRGVKEKQGSISDNSAGDASAAKEVVSPSMVDKNVEMEKLCSLQDTSVLGSFCHTSRRGLDGIRVRGRDVITIRTQGTRE
ncbi:hypothetical protein Tco_0231860 [Tanacetum coccineum]